MHEIEKYVIGNQKNRRCLVSQGSGFASLWIQIIYGVLITFSDKQQQICFENYDNQTKEELI